MPIEKVRSVGIALIVGGACVYFGSALSRSYYCRAVANAQTQLKPPTSSRSDQQNRLFFIGQADSQPVGFTARYAGEFGEVTRPDIGQCYTRFGNFVGAHHDAPSLTKPTGQG